MHFEQIQKALREEKLDGWLFFDHHGRDPLAYRILGLNAARTVTRRWYYFIPADGEPRALVHRIEAGVLGGLPGEVTLYSSWREQREGLRKILGGARVVAMQYSPECAIPYVSMIDAGTVELVRASGADVRSSANLVQYFEARWSDANLAAHMEAGRLVDRIRAAAFQYASERVRNDAAVNEYEVQQFIRSEFTRNGLFTDHGPIIAVNEHAGDPHYEPDAEHNSPIRKGDLLLIDLWAKVDRPEGVYYDITWTGFLGDAPPPEIDRAFDIVREARDRAVSFVVDATAAGRAIHGYEVDDAARGVIRDSGYGDAFVHRTGHSIGTDVHGAGANMDNLETRDERRIIPRTCFSVEPGIYLPQFGVRTEVNVYVGEDGARVTGEKQERLLRLA